MRGCKIDILNFKTWLSYKVETRFAYRLYLILRSTLETLMQMELDLKLHPPFMQVSDTFPHL